jgi:hypothetical protein
LVVFCIYNLPSAKLPHKTVILSGALHSLIALQPLGARSRRTSAKLNLPMLHEAFHHLMRPIHRECVLQKKILLSGFGG